MHTCKYNCKVLIGKKAVSKWNKRNSKHIEMSLGMLEHQRVCTVTVHHSKELHLSLPSFFLRWIWFTDVLHKTYNTAESAASLKPFSIHMCYQGTNMTFACVRLNRLDKKWLKVRECRTAAEQTLLQVEWKHCSHVLSLIWQVNRHRGRSIGWISVHGPCGSSACLSVDAALRDWPALQLWENGKAWWSVGEVHQCCVSTYSRLQADLTNLQREKEIRLQTQQKWSISTPTASLDASWTAMNWPISSQIWTFSS